MIDLTQLREGGLKILDKVKKLFFILGAVLLVGCTEDENEVIPVVADEAVVKQDPDNYEWFHMTSDFIDIPVNRLASETEGKTLIELFDDERYVRNTYGSIMEAKDEAPLKETIQSAMLDYDLRFLIAYSGTALENLEQMVADAYYSSPMILATVPYLQYGMVEAVEGKYFIHFNVLYTTNNIEMATIKPKLEEFYTGLELDGKTNDEKISIIHRAVIEQIEYVDGGDFRYHSPYGFFVLGEGVCQAYAIAMQMLLEKAGIESQFVVGYLTESDNNTAHAWNLVKTDEGWRHIDATSNDLGAANDEQVSLYFYKLTDEVASQYYFWDKKFYPEAE
ncbi:transglutaminase-like domain-containing protein [Ureibacillus chungkukjangi]|uniref:transglutaminase domain-containing protein n=1 Tax=Ureibacillus chungkukjangi TaxID=1202712 RepID=UPI00384D5C6D